MVGTPTAITTRELTLEAPIIHDPRKNVLVEVPSECSQQSLIINLTLILEGSLSKFYFSWYLLSKIWIFCSFQILIQKWSGQERLRRSSQPFQKGSDHRALNLMPEELMVNCILYTDLFTCNRRYTEISEFLFFISSLLFFKYIFIIAFWSWQSWI